MHRLLLQLFYCIMVAALEYPSQAFVPTLVCLLASDCCMPPSKLPPTAIRACLGQGMRAPSNLLSMPWEAYCMFSIAKVHPSLIARLACMPSRALFLTFPENVGMTATGRTYCIHADSYMPTSCLLPCAASAVFASQCKGCIEK